MVRRSAPASSRWVAKQWRLCRVRHSRHYAASRLCREIKTKEARRLHNARPAARIHVNMRHSPEPGSELFQKCQQFVVGLKAFGRSFDGIGLGQGLFLKCEVGIQIDVSSFDRLMS